jgi:hypothetical protein
MLTLDLLAEQHIREASVPDAAVGEIRDCDCSKKPAPDSAALHPGYP